MKTRDVGILYPPKSPQIDGRAQLRVENQIDERRIKAFEAPSSDASSFLRKEPEKRSYYMAPDLVP